MSPINNNILHELIAEWAELHRNGQLKIFLYDYAANGWRVFPVCWFNEAGECICGHVDKDGKPEPHTDNNIGKAPVTPNGFKDATQTRPGIDDFLKRYPLANWAGYRDRQLILDVDARTNGYQGLEKLQNDIGRLPETRIHQSGGGGLHIIYTLLDGVSLTASHLNGYPGLDIKINGYIVLPPSPHVSGNVYTVKNESPIAAAPDALIKLIQNQRKTAAVLPTTGAKIHNGEGRNVFLTSEAGRLLNIYKDVETVKTMIRALNQAVCDPPLAESDLTMFKSLKNFEIHETPGGNGHKTADAGATAPAKNYIITNDRGKPALDIAALAQDILTDLHFATFKDTEECLIYENGVYHLGGEQFIKAECQQRIGVNSLLTEHKVSEIIGHVKRSTYTDRDAFNIDTDVINLKNGLLNRKTRILNDHTPEYPTTIQIPVNYNPSADCPEIKKFWSEVLNLEDIPVIEELFGYCLIPDNSIQKAHLHHGDGGNGKSVNLNLLKTFVGPKNCSNVSLQDLEYNRFAKARLEGKLVNIYADLSAKALETTTAFKMLTGGDATDTEKKFKDGYSFINKAKFVFSANKPPKVTDEDSYAFWRRWIINEYPNQIPEDKRDEHKLEKLTTDNELSGLLNIALDGLDRLMSNHKYSYNKTVEEVTEYYLKASDPVYAFVKDCYEVNGAATTLKDAVYDAFKSYAVKNKIPVLKPNAFGRALQNQTEFHVKATKVTINGKQIPAWQGIGLAENEETPKLDGLSGIAGYSNPLRDTRTENIYKVEKNTANPSIPSNTDILPPEIPLEPSGPCPNCGSEAGVTFSLKTRDWQCSNCGGVFNA